jgi:hypothetical protein
MIDDIALVRLVKRIEALEMRILALEILGARVTALESAKSTPLEWPAIDLDATVSEMFTGKEGA